MKLCLVGAFPHIVKDCAKIFLRGFENVGPEVYLAKGPGLSLIHI